jgi:virginiamycin B lyase
MARARRIVEHRISTARAAPYAVAGTDDGAVWTTLIAGGAVVRRGRGGTLTTLRLGRGAQPSLIAAAGEDSVWVTDGAGNRLVHLGPEGVRGDVQVPTAGAHPFGVAVSAAGRVWFTEMEADRIGHLDSPRRGRSHGRVTEFPAGPAGGMPSMIACSGEDVWFTLNQAHAIGFVAGGESVVEVFELPTPGAGPVGVAVGADGAAWFTEILAGQVGRIDRQGTVREFPLPDRASKPHAITADPDGGCWLTLWASTQLGHLAEDGTLELIDLPTPGSEPHGLAVAPDGTVWVALETGYLAAVRP